MIRAGESGRLVALRCMLLDRIAAELDESLRERGVESILLRGPSIVRHLYPHQQLRGYADVDLLVGPGASETAQEVLTAHGFRLLDEIGRTPQDRPAWSRTWFRDGDGAFVDLHHTIVGAAVDQATVWTVLSEHVEPLEVSYRTLNGLDLDATAAIVALHAAQHGRGMTRTLDDLDHALERLGFETWRHAADVAAALGALAAFGTGLRLDPRGGAVAERLGLPTEASTEVVLRATTPPPTALGFEWLARKKGILPKAVFLAGKLLPPVDFMRAWSPLARRGRLGLALAYIWRPMWLAWNAVPGLRAWIAADRKARR